MFCMPWKTHLVIPRLRACQQIHEHMDHPHNLTMKNCIQQYVHTYIPTWIQRGIKEVQNRSRNTSKCYDLLLMINWTYNVAFTTSWELITLTQLNVRAYVFKNALKKCCAWKMYLECSCKLLTIILFTSLLKYRK